MRPWYKDRVVPPGGPPGPDGVAADYPAFADEMDGYAPDASYASREAFFRRHLYGRFAAYDGFLRRHLRPEMEILSVASGRCVNELALLGDGYRVACSDLGRPPCADATLRLFPEWRFETLDILAGPAPRSYDAVVSLSLIYALGPGAFETFLRNVRETLRPGGLFLLDGAGAPDNLLARLVHDAWLPLEARWEAWWMRREGVEATAERRHFGWRRTDGEIVGAASTEGLRLFDRTEGEFTNEFERTAVYRRFVPAGSLRERVFRAAGRFAPYVRLFAFRREA